MTNEIRQSRYVRHSKPAAFCTNPSSSLLHHQPGGAVVALLPIRPFLRIPLASSVLHVKLVFSAPHPPLRSTTPTDSLVLVPRTHIRLTSTRAPSLKAASRLSQEKTIPVPPPFVLKGGPLSAVEPPAGPRHWPAWRCLSPTRQVQCP
ncbi:hypothetical protein V8C44DRAFT_352354 [Trichoderma aethiopicum]